MRKHGVGIGAIGFIGLFIGVVAAHAWLAVAGGISAFIGFVMAVWGSREVRK